MDVVVRVSWEIVVDNQAHVGNVETTSCYIGGDENACSTSAKSCEIVDTLTLLQTRVQLSDTVVEQTEHVLQQVGGTGAVAEDDGRFG